MAGIATRVEAEGAGWRLEWRPGGAARAMRYLLGGVFFAVGLLFLALLLANGIAIAKGTGGDLIGGTILGVLLGAVFLPLGWWLLVARVSVVVKQGFVVERTDWRIGRRERARAVADYRAVAVSVEPLSGEDYGSRKAMGLRVALVPENPRRTAICELAWFEAAPALVEPARDLARRIGSLLERPVEEDLDWFFGAPAQGS